MEIVDPGGGAAMGLMENARSVKKGNRPALSMAVALAMLMDAVLLSLRLREPIRAFGELTAQLRSYDVIQSVSAGSRGAKMSNDERASKEYSGTLAKPFVVGTSSNWG